MKEIKFVDVGEGITEGHVQKWLVKDGDTVKEDQPVVQVETDKAVVNAPSPISGKIKINIPENSTVYVGDILAYIGEDSELANAKQTPAQHPAQQPAQQTPKPVQPAQQPTPPMQQAQQPQQSVRSTSATPQTPVQPKQKPQASQQAQSGVTENAPAGQQTHPQEIIATPNVRKLARDSNIDLSKVAGTGPGGRILENDVKGFINQNVAPQKHVEKFSEVLEELHADEIKRVPMSQTRKAIAKNVELSLSIPTFTHMDLINATSLYNIVKREKPNVEKLGVKLTFLPFIIKATIEALKENPMANSSYDHDRQEVVVKKYYNIGLAAEAPDGLKVIVIKDADKKNIVKIASEIQVLHEKINNQTITIDEMRDTSFTITNVGSLGGGFFSVPIINHPDVGILGVGIIRDMPIVENGQIKTAKIMPFSLVFDHRVVDGAEAVKFGNALIKYLEDPDFMEILG